MKLLRVLLLGGLREAKTVVIISNKITAPVYRSM